MSNWHPLLCQSFVKRRVCSISKALRHKNKCHSTMMVCSVMANSCDPMDCSPPASSFHRIFQGRILEWVAISSSKESSQPRDWNCVSCISCIGRQILYHWATWEAQVDTTEYPVNFYVKRFTLFFFNLSIFIYKEMKLHIKKIIVTWHKKKLAVQRNSMKIKLLLGPCSV